MDQNFGTVMPLVLKHEGGYVNHPKDPGGHTNKGVTLLTFQRYKPGATVADLKKISDEMVYRIYRDGYWNKVKGDQLPSGVDYAVFDFAVNSGPDRAAKYLQAAVGVKQDGIVGPDTLNAVAKHDPVKLVNTICDNRLAFLKRLATWDTFGKGWSSRVAGVRKKAVALAKEANLPAPTNSLPVEPPKPVLPLEPGTVVILKESPPQETRNWLLAKIIDFITALFGRK